MLYIYIYIYIYTRNSIGTQSPLQIYPPTLIIRFDAKATLTGNGFFATFEHRYSVAHSGHSTILNGVSYYGNS